MTESKHKPLSLKRGILALVLMYACQLLAGIIVSYGFKFASPDNTVPIEILGPSSALLSGILIISFLWWDIRRSGQGFIAEIGLGSAKQKNSKGLFLVIAALVLTHFLAWVYRSIILPRFDYEGILGGGSQMFNYIQSHAGPLEMSGFMLLALIIGPIMEEFVFRGYLQSSLQLKMPSWAAILITSIVFTIGHNPMVLWPMYFLYSATWGWILNRTGSLKMAILIHMLSNLFYALVGFAGWELLA